ncbi:MAG: FemAB family PEP-CTERM system-associated protein [Desulfuromonadales bacterium]|nr:FemAB family PEP-CTERM system-associated protein [Desulfuromonadales bacterium]
MSFMVTLVHPPSPEWEAYVNSHPEATNYHQFAWKQVIERSFGHEGFYLAARDLAGDIRGVLPLVHMRSQLFGRFLVSLPFLNYGGLLCDSPEAGDALVAEAELFKGRLGVEHVELRHVEQLLPGLATKNHKVTMLLDLASDEKGQWGGLDAKVRNQVRKAQKSGLTVQVGGPELLDGFYEVFCRNMRDLGTPVYGKVFFRNIFKEFPENTRILSVFLNDQVVASGILIWYRDRLEVPWASSIRDFRELCPNNLLYWEAIRFAIGQGARQFDFGRSTPGEGTFRFKSQWGAKPVSLSWQYLLDKGSVLPELNLSNPKYRLAIQLWQRLPVLLTRILGPRIVRSIP